METEEREIDLIWETLPPFAMYNVECTEVKLICCKLSTEMMQTLHTTPLSDPELPYRVSSRTQHLTGKGDIPSLVMTNSGIPSAGSIRVWKVQALHILGIELEIVDLGVLVDAGGRDALGQRDITLLQTPSQQDLSPRFTVFLAQRRQDLFVGPLAAHNGTVGLDDDVSLLRPLDDVVTRQPRVDLPLTDVDLTPVTG